MRRVKFYMSEVINFLILLPIYRPPYLTTDKFLFLDPFFTYGKVLAFAAALLVFVNNIMGKRFRSNRQTLLGTLLLIAFFGVLLISALVNGNLSDIGAQFLPIVTLIMLFTVNLQRDIVKWLRPLRFLLFVYALINAVTILLYPDGLYTQLVNEYSVRTAKELWFLGYRNPQIRLLLPALVISYLCDHIERGRLTGVTYALFVLVTFTVLRLHSRTALVGYILFLVLLYLAMEKDMTIHPRWFLILNAVFFVFVVLLRMQRYLSFIIVEILHRDITLSSRDMVWNLALASFIRKPILGPSITVYKLAEWYSVTHPHNFMLYVLCKGGLAGFALLTSFLVIVTRRLQAARDSAIGKVLLVSFEAFFVMTFVESLTEGMFFWVLLIMCFDVGELCRLENTWEDVGISV